MFRSIESNEMTARVLPLWAVTCFGLELLFGLLISLPVGAESWKESYRTTAYQGNVVRVEIDLDSIARAGRLIRYRLRYNSPWGSETTQSVSAVVDCLDRTRGEGGTEVRMYPVYPETRNGNELKLVCEISGSPPAVEPLPPPPSEIAPQTPRASDHVASEGDPVSREVLAPVGTFDDAQREIDRKDFRKAIRILTPLAQADDPRAQGVLAFLLALPGTSGQRDDISAFKWAKSSAESGSVALSKTILGMAYLTGRGVTRDTDRAIALFRAADQENDALAHYQLGTLMLVGWGMARDISGASELLSNAAGRFPALKESTDLLMSQSSDLGAWRQGKYRLSCTSFACAGKTGGASKKMLEAFENSDWISLAALVTSVQDRLDLNYFYLGRASEGLGDLSNAETYYRLALHEVQRGRPCKVGFINGCGSFEFPRDAQLRMKVVSEAQQEEVVRLAALQRERDRLETARLQQALVDAAEAKLREQSAKLQMEREEADRGVPEAQYIVAQRHLMGEGATKDARVGMQWLAKSAAGGFVSAQTELGQRYRTGDGVTRDEAKAEQWLAKAFAQGDPRARAGLEAIRLDREERALLAAAAARRLQAEREEVERRRKADAAAKLRSL